MNYRSQVFASVFLLALFLFAAGCQEDPGNAVALVRPVEGGVGALPEATGVDDVSMHKSLEAMWKNTDGVLMQVFKQTIDCRVGGVFTVRPVGWPEGYDVSLTVDPGTMPLNHGPIVEFALEIPVTGPAADALSVPYEFHPDGIRFNQPVHVAVAWPQWAGTAPTGGMHLWYLEREIHDGVQHYRVVDRAAEEIVQNTVHDKATEATIGHFSIAHFSRWDLSNDTDDGDYPIANLFGATLSTTEAGDCCWSDFAANATSELAVDF